MDELKADIKEIKKDLSEAKSVLIRNTAILDVHIKRTDLNESRIAKLEYWILGFLAALVVALIRLLS